MPQRAAGLIVALVGLVLVLALLALRLDVGRGSRSGPRWKRRLLAAGLSALAALGLFFPGAGDRAEAVVPTTSAAPPTGLEASAQWQRIAATWKQAAPLAAQPGQYPFNREGKERLLADLAQCAKDIDALAASELLNPWEADLLKRDLPELHAAVQATRPIEMRMATCYEPMVMPQPAHQSLGRLKERLPLLEKLAEARALQPAAVRTALQTIEHDLKVLGDESLVSKLKQEERAAATATRDNAARHIRTLKQRLGDAPATRPATGGGATVKPDLADAPDFRKVTSVFHDAAPFAQSGRSTELQRKALEADFAAAGEAIDRLTRSEQISSPEAELLRSEIASLRAAVLRNPPTDSMVMCYKMLYMPPARVSLNRLNQRLPLLQQLARDGKINAAALKPLLAGIEQDLATLGEPAQVGTLAVSEREHAAEVRRKAQAALDSLKELLAQPAPVVAQPVLAGEARLAADTRWRKVQAIQSQVQAALAGKAPAVADDQKARWLVSLAAAENSVDELRTEGLLDEARTAEAKRELSRLARALENPK